MPGINPGWERRYPFVSAGEDDSRMFFIPKGSGSDLAEIGTIRVKVDIPNAGTEAVYAKVDNQRVGTNASYSIYPTYLAELWVIERALSRIGCSHFVQHRTTKKYTGNITIHTTIGKFHYFRWRSFNPTWSLAFTPNIWCVRCPDHDKRSSYYRQRPNRLPVYHHMSLEHWRRILPVNIDSFFLLMEEERKNLAALLRLDAITDNGFTVDRIEEIITQYGSGHYLNIAP